MEKENKKNRKIIFLILCFIALCLGIYFYNRSNNSNKNNNPSQVNSNSNNNNNSNTSANKNNNLSQVKNNTSANNNNNIIKVLVVCSSDKDTATDFNIQQESISEVIIKNYVSSTNNPDPQIDFEFMNKIEGVQFPDNVKEDSKYDVMWFAGCNLIQWVFQEPEKTKEVFVSNLNDDGFVIFTESNRFNENKENDKIMQGTSEKFKIVKIDDYLVNDILDKNIENQKLKKLKKKHMKLLITFSKKKR